MSVKYRGHVPTEQYGFIEFEVNGEYATAVALYKDLQKEWNGGNGLVNKDWNRFLDEYVSTGKPPEDGMSLWQDMNDQQKIVINELKKCIKRINNH